MSASERKSLEAEIHRVIEDAYGDQDPAAHHIAARVWELPQFAAWIEFTHSNMATVESEFRTSEGDFWTDESPNLPSEVFD